MNEKKMRKKWIRRQLQKAELIEEELESGDNLEKFDVCRKAESRDQVKEELLDKMIQPFHFYKKEMAQREQMVESEGSDEDDWEEVE